MSSFKFPIRATLKPDSDLERHLLNRTDVRVDLSVLVTLAPLGSVLYAKVLLAGAEDFSPKFAARFADDAATIYVVGESLRQARAAVAKAEKLVGEIDAAVKEASANAAAKRSRDQDVASAIERAFRKYPHEHGGWAKSLENLAPTAEWKPDLRADLKRELIATMRVAFDALGLVGLIREWSDPKAFGRTTPANVYERRRIENLNRRGVVR